MAREGSSGLQDSFGSLSLLPSTQHSSPQVDVALFRFPGSRFPRGLLVPNVFYIEPASARILQPDDRIGPFGLETWSKILSYLKPGSLKSMACISAEMRELALSELFDTVDLSVQSRTIYDPRLRDKQRLFAEEVLRKPEYGQLVRRFAWTFGLLPFARTTSRERKIYAMFSRMTNVESIYIDVIPGYGVSSIPPQELGLLFPHAVHVTLKGEIHERLAAAILLGERRPFLKTLVIENVEDGYWIANNISSRVLPLTIVHNRCVRLEYLRLKKECIDFWHHEYDKTDAAIYGNWACFIVMARPRHLSIEHGIHMDSEATTLQTVHRWLDEGEDQANHRAHPDSENIPSTPVTPMSPKPPPPPSELEMHSRYLGLKASDMRFRALLAPTIGQGWDDLEKLSIRGVDPSAVILPDGIRCRLETIPG